MNIGIVPDPQGHPDWPRIEAMLAPAAELANEPVLRPNAAVWAVYAPELTGAAVACLKSNGIGEIPLVGGRDFRRWIRPLDDMIGKAMREHGMHAMRACGRKGWRRVLTNWTVIGTDDDMTIYERAL